MAKFRLFSLLVIFGFLGVKSSSLSSDGVLNEEARLINCSSASGHPKDCGEIQRELNVSGVQACAIYPFGENPSWNSSAVEVLCDFETDGGGWTIIQRRATRPKEGFYRNWADYAAGFYGSESEGARGNYWIGLDVVHALTSQPSSNQSLRVDLTYWNNRASFAQYSSFSVGDSSSNYTLNVSGYSANSSAPDRLAYHNGMQFSTRDRDNDLSEGSCAQSYKGAWWYNSCYESNLNGLYLNPSVDVYDYPCSGIQWTSSCTFNTLQKSSSLKIRDADFTKSLSLH